MYWLLAFIIFTPQVCLAWDSEQLEVFDVVEEVQENFYNLLNISNDASHDQIKSAFRKLSLKLHPDKNVDRDTSAEFRNLVSVYDVLKTPSKRKYYDEILKNGLPNWRSAVYYYRYVRKMGMTEVIIILFTIITIGQYLVNWAAYLEKKYEMEQIRKKKSKKLDRDQVEIFELEKPSVFNTLPIQIPRLIWFLLMSLPHALISLKSMLSHQIKETITKPPEEEPPIDIPRVKTIRKRNKGFTIPEGPNFETTYNTKTSEDSSSGVPVVCGGLWTDDDLSELIRLVKKYPGGTSNRWEIIAEALSRSVPEVTYMAAKMKENGYRLPNEEEKILEPVIVKLKTKKDILPEESKEVLNWSQEQQKVLEEALLKYPKGCNDRWDRIAEHVPNKTKEECMLRFRYLAENLKRQKEKERNQEENEEKESNS